MKATSGNVRASEFTEAEYISSFERMLSHSTLPLGLTISQISQTAERELGYDGVLTSCVPLYIQFKKPNFCTPDFSGQSRKDRDAIGLWSKQGYFTFNLHRDKTSLKFDQHNALWRLAQVHKAAYVAPLFYRRTQLDYFRFLQGHRPWRYEDAQVYDSLGSTSFASVAKWFPSSVTISPHREVFDKGTTHSYTFDKTLGICFHSEPEPIERGVTGILQFLQSIGESLRPFEAMEEMAATLMKTLKGLYGEAANQESFFLAFELSREELGFERNNIERRADNFSGGLTSSQVFLIAEIMLKRDFNIMQLFAQR